MSRHNDGHADRDDVYDRLGHVSDGNAEIAAKLDRLNLLLETIIKAASHHSGWFAVPYGQYSWHCFKCNAEQGRKLATVQDEVPSACPKCAATHGNFRVYTVGTGQRDRGY